MQEATQINAGHRKAKKGGKAPLRHKSGTPDGANPQRQQDMHNPVNHCTSRQKVRPMQRHITAPALSERKDAQSYVKWATRLPNLARPQEHSEESKAKNKQEETTRPTHKQKAAKQATHTSTHNVVFAGITL